MYTNYANQFHSMQQNSYEQISTILLTATSVVFSKAFPVEFNEIYSAKLRNN